MLTKAAFTVFDHKYSKNSDIVKYYYKNELFLFEYILKCDLFL